MPAIEEVLMMTPRCPSPSAGSVRAMAAAAMRMRLKVPIRLTLMSRWKGARACGGAARPTVAAGEQPAGLAGHPLAGVFVQVGDDHRGACRGERPRGRLAQPACAAGDD